MVATVKRFLGNVDMAGNKILNLIIDDATENNQPVTLLQLQTAGSDKTCNFTQLSPANVWVINHGLGKYPAVSVVDSAGTLVFGNVQYIDNNNITISFGSSFGGNAYLN